MPRAKGQSYRTFTEPEKLAMIQMRAQGHTLPEIARTMGKTVRGCAYFFAKVRAKQKDAPEYDYKADLEQRAVKAVRVGLDAKRDPYKRAGVGIAVLKGIGVFNAENQVNINALVNAVPPEYAERYRVTTSEEKDNHEST